MGILGKRDEIAQARANYAQLLLRLGCSTAAREVLKRGLAEEDEDPSGRGEAMLRCVLGDVLLNGGRAAESIAHLEKAESWLSSAGISRELRVCRRHLSFARLAVGDEAAALRLDGAAAAEEEPSDVDRARFAMRLKLHRKEACERELESLVAALPKEQDLRRGLALEGIADAVRGALACEEVDAAVRLASVALEIARDRRALTPGRLRESKDPLEEEMKLVLEKYAPRVDATAGTEDAWRRLARINTRLNSETRLGSLLDLIMDTALDVTGAQRGFLLLVGKGDALEVRSARNMDRASLEGSERGYSRSVAERAFETGRPVNTTDAQEDPEFNEMRSVVALELRHIMAVPLQVQGKVTGTIYVDSRKGGDPAARGLALLEALADQAAIAITNTRLAAQNRRRQRDIERLNRRLSRELESREADLARARVDLKEKAQELARRYELSGIVGRSRRMVEIFRLLDRITAAESPCGHHG